MGNEPPTLGSDDGTIDVERLLVEPQDGNVSMDSVMCFNEKMTDDSVNLEPSRRYGRSETDITRDKEDILNDQVLDVMPSEAGYFQLHNDFCSMGDDYLLGVEFAESITNIDYGSGEGFQASVSDSRIHVPSAGSISPWKSEMMEIPDFQNTQFNTGSSESTDVPELHDCGILAEENSKNAPESCTSQNVDNTHVKSSHSSQSSDCGILTEENSKNGSESSTSRNIDNIHDKSCHSFQNSISDENEGRLSPSDEMICSPKIEKSDEEMTEQDDTGKRPRRRRRSSALLSHGGCSDVLSTQKRLRKPTQRYIDELTYPIAASKKRQECSSPAPKDESTGTRGRKKGQNGPKVTKSDEEEFSVKAIQVPFASIGNQEQPESRLQVVLHCSDSKNLTTKSKDDLATPDSQKRKNGSNGRVQVRKRDNLVTGSWQKKTDDNVALSHFNKRNTRAKMSNKKKKDDWVMTVCTKKKDTRLTVANGKKNEDLVVTVSPKKRENHLTAAKYHKKRDNCINSMCPNKVDTRLSMVQYQNKDDCITSTIHKKRDDDDDDGDNDVDDDDKCVSISPKKKRDKDFAEESPEKVNGRRKHHRLWTISEVRKLLDGVSQYGVGRWSRIKKLFFASSPHRTSVDLKDKWRNLLKASGIYEQSRNGEKKRNVAWRPLPKSVLRHVRELAAMYPYPKGQGRRTKIPRITNNDSSDGSTDITLSDYRRILQSTTTNGE